MLNQVIVVGRITNDPELKTSESGKKCANLTLAVPRNYKNAEGIYDTDFINVSMFGALAESFAEYTKKGDIMSVNGRLESNVFEKDEKQEHRLNVVAERIQFLTSRAHGSKEKDDRGDR